jgi:hypothetical protein
LIWEKNGQDQLAQINSLSRQRSKPQASEVLYFVLIEY